MRTGPGAFLDHIARQATGAGGADTGRPPRGQRAGATRASRPAAGPIVLRPGQARSEPRAHAERWCGFRQSDLTHRALPAANAQRSWENGHSGHGCEQCGSLQHLSPGSRAAIQASTSGGSPAACARASSAAVMTCASALSPACSNRGMDVRRPRWWSYAGSAHTTDEFRLAASSACRERPPSAPAGGPR